MGGLFGGSTPDIPQAEDPAVAEARRKQAEALRRARGRSSTILNSAAGLTSDAIVGRPQLLGSNTA